MGNVRHPDAGANSEPGPPAGPATAIGQRVAANAVAAYLLIIPPCPQCGGPLEISQPQTEQPARLLGACEGCDAWHELRSTGLQPIERVGSMVALESLAGAILCAAVPADPPPPALAE